MGATCAPLSLFLTHAHSQTAKAALLCVDFSLGCSAAFNGVSASDSIKLLSVTEYSNATAPHRSELFAYQAPLTALSIQGGLRKG